MQFVTTLLAIILFFALLYVIRQWGAARRREFIRTYTLPRGLYEKLQKKYPQFGPKEFQLVAQALRQFFCAYARSGGRYVSMPSQVVDELWHEFILYTREYQKFCQQAFGRFLHHTPAVVLSQSKNDNEGLRRVWWHTCKEENINPLKATRLPLLFAIDKKLGVGNGFHYTLDCKKFATDQNGSPMHCTSDFSDSSFDGGTDGLGDDSSSDFGSDSSSDGGSDSGCSSGCGGGCGGD
jgi:hypothetical protein